MTNNSFEFVISKTSAKDVALATVECTTDKRFLRSILYATLASFTQQGGSVKNLNAMFREQGLPYKLVECEQAPHAKKATPVCDEYVLAS